MQSPASRKPTPSRAICPAGCRSLRLIPATNGLWQHLSLSDPLADGTYELCGPHFNSNREKLDHDAFFRHGDIVLEGVPRDFNGIRAYLEMHNIEGIVFHRGNGEMCKIKRSDFGFRWG